MERVLTDQEFQKCIEHYYQVLKKGYLKEIKVATNKEYAREYYQRVFFLENEFVPYSSVLFRELRFTYDHFNCLNTNSAYSKTFELLDQIKIVTKKRLNDAIKRSKGDKTILLSDWYTEQIESARFDLDQIIQIETKVLESSVENLSGALAIHLAGQKLYNEFSIQKIDRTKPTDHKHQFTQKEQLLALYFLMQSFGLNLYQLCDRTKLAALFHLIMGIPFNDSSKLKNLSIYSSLGIAPHVVEDKQLLKYLQNIRPYFQNAELSEAVKLIDKHIEMCQAENK